VSAGSSFAVGNNAEAVQYECERTIKIAFYKMTEMQSRKYLIVTLLTVINPDLKRKYFTTD
jgi:hypothetical protein